MPDFHPYVPGTLLTVWYRKLEKKGKASTMWSMWFVYFMHINQLYSVYSNLQTYTGLHKTSLVVNRGELGLHYTRRHFAFKRNSDASRLLNDWKDEYVVFPLSIARLNWNGSCIPDGTPY